MNFDLTNQRIEHRYQVMRVIGAGGMATIFEALDQNLGKRVAVKVLNPPFWGDPIQVARFQREARAIARIRHPNLVDVTHHGITDEGMPFLVMELLEGWDLLIELRRLGGAMPWRRALTLAIQACGALGAAHDAGVVHRDIKPSNCFLVRAGEGGERVKLLDLGIARVIAAKDEEDEVPLTQAAGGVPGTLHYMSPEQIRGEPVDPRSDIYSLGVVLYRMLTGVLPFVAGNDAAYELMRMHCEDPPRPPSEIAPAAGIPPALEEAVLKALAKEPGDRFASARAFAEALRAVEAESSAALVAPLGAAPAAAAGRRRLGLWVGGSALAAGLVGLALLGIGDG
ncbi:MAG: serine/threonine protein kinase [Myxococcales bacterium]|nr:serine/threonine protein kinase [Myxococcales bacterium]